MHDTTERPEDVDAGTLKLVGSNEETIYKTFKLLLENEDEYNKMSHACNRTALGNVRTLHPGYELPSGTSRLTVRATARS